MRQGDCAHAAKLDAAWMLRRCRDDAPNRFRGGDGGACTGARGSACRRGWRGKRARQEHQRQDVLERRRAGHPPAGDCGRPGAVHAPPLPPRNLRAPHFAADAPFPAQSRGSNPPPVHRGHLHSATRQRHHARQRVCDRGARLHDGLRHHPAHQLRARRGRDDRRDGRLHGDHRARGRRRASAADRDPRHCDAVRDPGVHDGRLRDGAGCLPAAAQCAPARAADHRDRYCRSSCSTSR